MHCNIPLTFILMCLIFCIFPKEKDKSANQLLKSCSKGGVTPCGGVQTGVPVRGPTYHCHQFPPLNYRSKGPFKSSDSDATAMSLLHRSRMAHKAIPQRHPSDVAVARCNNATPKQLIRFGSDVAATSQSLDVNGL